MLLKNNVQCMFKKEYGESTRVDPCQRLLRSSLLVCYNLQFAWVFSFHLDATFHRKEDLAPCFQAVQLLHPGRLLALSSRVCSSRCYRSRSDVQIASAHTPSVLTYTGSIRTRLAKGSLDRQCVTSWLQSLEGNTLSPM